MAPCLLGEKLGAIEIDRHNQEAMEELHLRSPGDQAPEGHLVEGLGEAKGLMPLGALPMDSDVAKAKEKIEGVSNRLLQRRDSIDGRGMEVANIRMEVTARAHYSGHHSMTGGMPEPALMSQRKKHLRPAGTMTHSRSVARKVRLGKPSYAGVTESTTKCSETFKMPVEQQFNTVL